MALTDGLISAWRFENNFLDSVGLNHGTNVGTTFLGDELGITPQGGGAHSGDAIVANSTYVDCGASATLDLISNLTISAWVNRTSVNDVYDHVAGRGSIFGSYYGILSDYAHSNNIAFGGRSGSQFWFVDSGITGIGSWNHFVGVVEADGTTARIYVNGVLANTGINLTPIAPLRAGDKFVIGYGVGWPENGYYFLGAIDEVSVWNRALSAEEVALLYYTAPSLEEERVLIPGMERSIFSKLARVKSMSDRYMILPKR